MYLLKIMPHVISVVVVYFILVVHTSVDILSSMGVKFQHPLSITVVWYTISHVTMILWGCFFIHDSFVFICIEKRLNLASLYRLFMYQIKYPELLKKVKLCCHTSI